MAELIELGASQDFVAGKNFARPFFVLAPALTVNGALSVEQIVTLPRNAVVKPPFTVTVKAGPADWATAASVATLRQHDISGAGQQRASVVLDFGVMRTISAVGLRDLSTLQIIQIKQWAGTTFIDKPLATGLGGGEFSTTTNIDSSTPKLDSSLGLEVDFPSEVRTDRLQIDLIAPSTTDYGSQLLVQVPDLPADLDIRINGGQPVWNWPGAVPQPPSPPGSPGVNIKGWSVGADGLMYQQVDVSAGLTALLGDPGADIGDQIDLHIVLSARSPGALELDLPDPSTCAIRYVANTAPVSNAVVFANEGEQDIKLPLPSYASSVERVTLTANANLPPERVIPPVGPDAAFVSGQTTPLAEMLLDPSHSACVAVPQTAQFGELLALRFPLIVEDGGAEMHVQLRQANKDGDPGDLLPGAVTKPSVLDANAAESWATFSYARPVTLVPSLPASLPVYAQIVARRGSVRWALTGTAAAGQVFSGPPTGPWAPLPPLGELAALRGRVRVVGHARPDAPVAPLTFSIQGPSLGGIDVTPNPKGVAVDMSSASEGLPATPDAGKVTLKVVSRIAGSITLGQVVSTVAKT